MPRIRAWFFRLFGLFSKDRRNVDLAEEIQQHVDRLTERNIAAGMLPYEARNAARRQFGGVEQLKELAREQRIWRWGDELLQDIRVRDDAFARPFVQRIGQRQHAASRSDQ